MALAETHPFPLPSTETRPLVQSTNKISLTRSGHAASLVNIMKNIITTVIFISLALASCQNNDAGDNINCSGTEVLFASDVKPIIQSTCSSTTSCHATGSTRGPGALTTYNQIFNSRSSIKSSVASGRMPENSSLTSSQKATIICWIESGASNN